MTWRKQWEGLILNPTSELPLRTLTDLDPHNRVSHGESETTCRLKKIYGTSTKCRFTTAILSCKYETVQNLENHWTTKYEPDSSFIMMPGGVVTHNSCLGEWAGKTWIGH